MKHIKQLFALFLCLCLFVGGAVPAFAEAKAIDIYDDSYYYYYDRTFRVETSLADELKALGLFNGRLNADGTVDYALEKAPTRVEALVLYLRVLGKDQEALSQDWEHPFTDVPPWANKYVGYAYQMGYTKGVKDDEEGHLFGSGNATANMYLTFVLRALGYTDSGEVPDFSWRDPQPLARSLGLLPYQVDTEDFLRADAVSISHAALSAEVKGGGPLYERLIEQGVFTKETLTEVTGLGAVYAHKRLSAEEIYAKCSSAVFYIEVYDSDGWITKTGSGFFINRSGMAVTNYHVISGAAGLDVYTTDGEWYDVAGVYDYSVEEDWAIIQVEGTGFNYLRICSEEPAGGATVYTIGSPLGLQNTIAQGLISNPARWDNGVKYIQTSAAISHGSSGGALVDKYGEVIGVTSATYEDGQNLNLALPMSYVMQAYTEGELYSFAEISSGEIVGFLTLDVEEVYLNTGDFYPVVCTADVYSDGSPWYMLEYYIYTDGIIGASWEGWDGNSNQLILEAVESGATQVVVWLYASEDVDEYGDLIDPQILDTQLFMVYVDTPQN